jgi:hypothetical protein
VAKYVKRLELQIEDISRPDVTMDMPNFSPDDINSSRKRCMTCVLLLHASEVGCLQNLWKKLTMPPKISGQWRTRWVYSDTHRNQIFMGRVLKRTGLANDEDPGVRFRQIRRGNWDAMISLLIPLLPNLARLEIKCHSMARFGEEHQKYLQRLMYRATEL